MSERNDCNPVDYQIHAKCSRDCAVCGHDTSSHRAGRCESCMPWFECRHPFRCTRHYQVTTSDKVQMYLTEKTDG